MSVRGVRQLRRLTVTLCEHSGSSRGARVLRTGQPVELLKPAMQAKAQEDAAHLLARKTAQFPTAAEAQFEQESAAAALRRFVDINPSVEVQFLRRNGRAPVVYGDYGA
jgi:hypothetical protein